MNQIHFASNDEQKVMVISIHSFSEELQDLIRQNLSRICFGPYKSERNTELYSYKRTLREFLNRFERQTEKTKKGMIGELLTHIFLFQKLDSLVQASPFFNSEERSIKKGFDIVYYGSNEKKIWLTEVKSGASQKETLVGKNRTLLLSAKKDIQEKFLKTTSTIWHNAISGVENSVRKGKLKEEVLKILEQTTINSETNSSVREKNNAILSSVLYCETSSTIDISTINTILEEFKSENTFSDLIIITIQKTTFQKVYDFLVSELPIGQN